mmetsp:Transcript_9502/g.26918  ORF Transcript_9502/g.26918 Transcript_9502/m.26918 type:complete len:225 (-) Transcript_9502:1750-2424(-)
MWPLHFHVSHQEEQGARLPVRSPPATPGYCANSLHTHKGASRRTRRAGTGIEQNKARAGEGAAGQTPLHAARPLLRLRSDSPPSLMRQGSGEGRHGLGAAIGYEDEFKWLVLRLVLRINSEEASPDELDDIVLLELPQGGLGPDFHGSHRVGVEKVFEVFSFGEFFFGDEVSVFFDGGFEEVLGFSDPVKLLLDLLDRCFGVVSAMKKNVVVRSDLLGGDLDNP